MPWRENTKKKQNIQWDLKSKYKGILLEGAIHMNVKFYFQPTKSTTKTKQLEMLRGIIPYAKKPDLTNLIKFIEDCCTGVVWKDDNQIVSVTAEKLYATKAKTLLYIREVNLWDE